MRTPAEFVAKVFAMVADALQSTEKMNVLQSNLDALGKSFGQASRSTFVFKANAKKRMVYGWASVVNKGGEAVEDLQGDVITSIDNLREVVHEFMASRVGKAMHEGAQVGVIADSIIFDSDLQAALGIDLGCEGWFVGYKVTDDAIWKRVEDGELRAFSIGGAGERTEIKEQA